jgi:hypothetical protein
VIDGGGSEEGDDDETRGGTQESDESGQDEVISDDDHDDDDEDGLYVAANESASANEDDDDEEGNHGDAPTSAGRESARASGKSKLALHQSQQSASKRLVGAKLRAPPPELELFNSGCSLTIVF